MITITNVKKVSGNKSLVDIACSSTDTKPTEFMNGSMAIEVDTGDVYIYDEAEAEWNKIG